MVTVFVIVLIVGVSSGAAWLGWLSMGSITYGTAPIEEVFKRHCSFLLNLPGVRSVGIGEVEGRPCIAVLAKGLSKNELLLMPTHLEGWDVCFLTNASDPGLAAVRMWHATDLPEGLRHGPTSRPRNEGYRERPGFVRRADHLAKQR